MKTNKQIKSLCLFGYQMQKDRSMQNDSMYLKIINGLIVFIFCRKDMILTNVVCPISYS